MSRPIVLPRVVFVDDNEIMREVWPLLLAPLGFDVATAKGGRHAMRVARICHPDAIVTDMTMPAMTGIDLFNALPADDVLHVIPVIFMTSGLFPWNVRVETVGSIKTRNPSNLLEKSDA